MKQKLISGDEQDVIGPQPAHLQVPVVRAGRARQLPAVVDRCCPSATAGSGTQRAPADGCRDASLTRRFRQRSQRPPTFMGPGSEAAAAAVRTRSASAATVDVND